MIASFFLLLGYYIAPELHDQKNYFATLTVYHWPWPVTWLARCFPHAWRSPASGLTWFNIIWISIFQYCFIKVSTTIIATATEATGHYCLTSLNPSFAHVWVQIFALFSVTLAMYMLIAFYLNTRVALAPKKPLLKLLAIKLVIFFCLYQGLVLDFIAATGAIKPTTKISYGDISVGFNALLICFEMILFAILHLFAYPWSPYTVPNLPTSPAPLGFRKAILDALNPWDIIKALARGTKWTIMGRRRRAEEAGRVAERAKQPSLESEEVSGLTQSTTVPPSSWPGGWGGVYDNPPAEGLTVLHPTPQDQENVPQPPEVPTHGLVETHHEGFRRETNTVSPLYDVPFTHSQRRGENTISPLYEDVRFARLQQRGENTVSPLYDDVPFTHSQRRESIPLQQQQRRESFPLQQRRESFQQSYQDIQRTHPPSELEHPYRPSELDINNPQRPYPPSELEHPYHGPSELEPHPQRPYPASDLSLDYPSNLVEPAANQAPSELYGSPYRAVSPQHSPHLPYPAGSSMPSIYRGGESHQLLPQQSGATSPPRHDVWREV